MEREGRRIVTRVLEIPIIQVPRVGELGVMVKECKKVPRGMSSDDESLGNWRFAGIEFYSLSYRDPPIEPRGKKPRS